MWSQSSIFLGGIKDVLKSKLNLLSYKLLSYHGGKVCMSQ